MKFSHQIYEQFIELVRQNPCLYDKTPPIQIRDPKLKTQTWLNITQEMGIRKMTVEDWKKLWRQKRDSYIKKRREVQNCSSPSAAKAAAARYPLYDQLSFLAEHATCRRSVCSLGDETQQNFSDDSNAESSSKDFDATAFETSAPYEDETDRFTTEDLRAVNAVRTGETSSRISSNSNNNHNRKKRRRESGTTDIPFDTATVKLEPTATTCFTTTTTDSVVEQAHEPSIDDTMGLVRALPAAREDEGDFNDNIFTFIAKRFKSFSPATQSWLEDEVMQLYMQAKKRDLNQA